jgi:putative flagellar protein
VRRLPPERALLYRKMGGLSSGKNKKAAKKMKKADFLSLLTAFAASSFHEGASLQGHKGPIPEGAGIAQR